MLVLNKFIKHVGLCVILVKMIGCSPKVNTETEAQLVQLDSLNKKAREYLKIDLDTAEMISRTVFNQAVNDSDFVNEASASLILGRYYYEKGICDSSIWMFRNALHIGQELGDSLLIGKGLTNIATSYMCTGDFRTSLIYSDSAYKVFSPHFKFEYMAKAASNAAISHIQMDQYEEAKPWFQKAILHGQRSENTSFLVNLYNNYGLFNRDFGSKDTGRYYLNKAIELARRENYHVSLGTIYLNYGQDLQKENPALSKAYLDSAYIISKQYKLHDLEEIVLGAKAISLRDMGMPVDVVGDAYEAYVKKVKDNEELGNSQSFAEFGVKYNIAEKESENLRLINNIQKKEHKQRLIVIVALLLLLTSIFIIRSLYMRHRLAVLDKQIYQQKIDALLKSQEIQNIDTMLEVQADERTRIATELHDRLGSILSAVKLNFSSMEEHFGDQQESAKVRFNVVKTLIDDATSEVRKISHDMASGVRAKFGLLHAVDHLKQALEASGKIKINLYVHGMDERLSGTQEMILYRILQELISNALKHGIADDIDVHFIKENGKVTLIVEDNGIGFDEKEIQKSTGLGLPNIRKRIESAGGKFNIDSNHKSGTTVILELPIIA